MDYRDLETGATEDFFWFKAKAELIDVLLQKVRGRGRGKILSIGCGVSKELEILKRRGEVYVVDIEPKALALVRDDLCAEKRLCDVCDGVPYPDASFDMVVTFDVLEHLEKDSFVVGEIHRVLKPGGTFLFTVPAFQFLFSGHDRALQHRRRYNRRMLKDLLRDFRCVETGYWVCSLFLPVAVARIAKRHEDNTSIHSPALGKSLNGLFYRLLMLENRLIGRGVRLPVGTTIYGVYEAA